MAYTDRFIPTDTLIANLQPTIAGVFDAAVKANYAGFLSVSAITVYELAIKDIFNDFATKKNKVFGVYTQTHFSRINGQIFIRDLTGKHIISFGEKYKDKFNKILQAKERAELAVHAHSIINSYSNLIQCRHDFVHKGMPTLTVAEVMLFYSFGKSVIQCLDEAMKR